MTVSVNLLPASYRRRRERMRRVGLWALVLLAAVTAEAGAWLVLRGREQAVRQLYSGTESLRRRSASLRQQLARAEATRGYLERRLALVASMKGRLVWSRILERLAATVPEGIMLTKLATIPTAPAAASPPSPVSLLQALGADKKPPPETDNDDPEGLVMTGLATDHQELARLIGMLNTCGLFSRVQLVHAGSLAPSRGARAAGFEAIGTANRPAGKAGSARGPTGAASLPYTVTFEVSCSW